jgi:hypothetical protein
MLFYSSRGALNLLNRICMPILIQEVIMATPAKKLDLCSDSCSYRKMYYYVDKQTLEIA